MTDPDHDSTRHLFGRALADEPPLGLHAEHLAATGRSRLRQRRAALAGGALAVAGLALAGLFVAPTGADPHVTAPPPTATSAPPGTGCATDPGQRPPAQPQPLPAPAAVTAAVRAAAGERVRQENGPSPEGDTPVTKYRYHAGGTATVDIEITPAGDATAEIAWAVAAARHECRNPTELTLPDGVTAVATGTPDGHLVIAVGDGLRVSLAIAAPGGATPPLSRQQAVDLAATLTGLG